MLISNRISWSVVDGGAIVLDIESGRFYALDAATTTRWCALIDGTDDRDLLHEVRARGWNAPVSAHSPKAPPGTRQPFLRALRGLRQARRLLDTEGFSTALAWLAATEVAPRDRPLASCLTAFQAAEAALPERRGADDCLPRSIALAVTLRGLGHAAEQVVGVCRFPFRAHAWVELDGSPMLESRFFPPQIRPRTGFHRLLVT